MEKRKNYNAIDLMKYICTILVIMVHTSPLKPYNEEYNWLLMTILGRFVVPFFFISSGYFIFMNVKKADKSYFPAYIRSLIKIYLIWSILYLPLGLDYIATQFELPIILYPIALLLALLYIGTYFHLWYIPALIFSLWFVHWFMKHFKKRTLFILSLILFLLGSLETYYGFIQIPFIVDAIDFYMGIFITTRNGLFFGIFYVSWGYFIAQENTWITRTKYHARASILCFVLVIAEAFLIHNSNNLDSNILISAAPFTICMFLYCKDLNLTWNLPYRRIREYSSLYYFTHAYFLVLIPVFLSLFNKEWLYLDHGAFRFISVLLCTHFISKMIYHVERYVRKRKKLKTPSTKG